MLVLLKQAFRIRSGNSQNQWITNKNVVKITHKGINTTNTSHKEDFTTFLINEIFRSNQTRHC